MKNTNDTDSSQHIEPERIKLRQQPDKIYTRSFSGRYRNLRLAGGVVLFILFFGTCWLNWGNRQAVLFDLAQRQFHIFGMTLWPQDFILLSWLLIICALGLFAITVFAGRVWCGYTCPQSVFTWVFMWAEKLAEGERNKRIKLDKQSFSGNKLLKKIAKHLLWLLIAFATASSFVGYFTPVRQLMLDIASLEISAWTGFWLLFFTLATYINAGWLREIVCLHMCPYARFQSVMFDNDTLVVAYDEQRGEHRGARKRNVSPNTLGLGDCIDCKVCVQVCPTGIDIRNGLQYQCIDCAACIDGCDSIMDKMGYSRGLISYTTANTLAGKKTQLLRPRLTGYIAVLLVIIGLFSWNLTHRAPLKLDVIRDRNTLFRTLTNGDVENSYLVKITNKTEIPHTITLSVAGIENAFITKGKTYTIEPYTISEHLINVSAPFSFNALTSRAIQLTAVPTDASLSPINAESRFITPYKKTNNNSSGKE